MSRNAVSLCLFSRSSFLAHLCFCFCLASVSRLSFCCYCISLRALLLATRVPDATEEPRPLMMTKSGKVKPEVWSL